MEEAAPASGTEVCSLEQIPDGGGRMFILGADEAIFRLLVLRSGKDCFGYRNRCPHFGVPLATKDEQLIIKAHQSVSCNTHYARFRWQDGYCEAGDCVGESLAKVALQVTQGIVRFA